MPYHLSHREISQVSKTPLQPAKNLRAAGKLNHPASAKSGCFRAEWGVLPALALIFSQIIGKMLDESHR
jgi:hypothetical protein